MPFLSHSIPWLSLSNLFEYHPARSRPGPQEADLYGKEGPAHRKQLEHFARTFQETVREHATIERGRYSTAESYRDRASSWTKSSVEEPPEPGQETRRVYPSSFLDTYMSLEPPTSPGGAYGRHGLLESLADISTWIDHCTAKTRFWASREDDPSVSYDWETRDALSLDNMSCSDVLRLLLIDASTTNDKSQRTKRLSTLLLLANHPGVELQDFMNDGMSCCNILVGMSALVDKTVMVFIYFNLLLALAGDDQDAELLRPCHSLEEFNGRFGLYGRYGERTLMRLVPRPAYMNTLSFARVLEYALDEHGHAVEHVLFSPILAPRVSGCRSKWLRVDTDWRGYLVGNDEMRFERDVMAERQSLGEALKQMWRVLIFCDMIFREADEPINWEMVSLTTIRELFPGKACMDKILGQEWGEYRADREEEGGFKFYANWTSFKG